MARGAAKQRSTRPKPDAQRRRRPVTSGYDSVESQLFFYRLRRHAKWMFVFLALVFAGGFVFFGVGSGSSIGDLLQGNFDFGGGGGGSSVSKLEKQVAQHPRDAKAQLDLAEALQRDNRPQEAISPLERYIALRPKDSDALSLLAALYQGEATRQGQEYQLALAQAQSAAPRSPLPELQLANGQTLGTDPISQTLTSDAQERANKAITAAIDASRNAERIYGKLVALSPADTTLLFQYADAARSANDTKAAIIAYKKFVKLAPDDPKTPVAKQYIKQLAPKPPPKSGG